MFLKNGLNNLMIFNFLLFIEDTGSPVAVSDSRAELRQRPRRRRLRLVMFDLLRAGEAVRGFGNRSASHSRRDGPDQGRGGSYVLRRRRRSRVQERQGRQHLLRPTGITRPHVVKYTTRERVINYRGKL